MRKLLVALGGLFLCLSANAQNGAVGLLTAAGADCTTAGACITLQFEGNDVASSSIQLSGTFTATVQFEASSDKGTTWVAISGVPLNSSTAVTSATTANTWKFNVASLTNIRARASAWTSSPTAIIRSSRGDPASVGAGAATTTSGTASAVTQPGYPMMCDTAASGTVTVGQAQMVRCTNSGVLATAITASVGDGATNANAYVLGDLLGTGANNAGLRVAPNLFNGSNWDHFRSAALANFTIATTLTGRNSIGAAVTEKGSRWMVISNPAAGSQATASIASEASVRHVVDCISFSAASTTAPVLTALTVNVRDGATGAGTIIWTNQVVISAGTGQNVAPVNFCGLNLVGTTATAMTLEFSASLANLIESVSISGYNVN